MLTISQDGYQPWTDAGIEPQLRIENIVKSFDGFNAVDNVSLDIYRGEFFSLLGGSGCGKTTLLRMLAGFLTPDSGSLSMDGLDLVPLPPYERPLNMMFQSYALFPHMTVENNIAFGLRRDGVPKDEVAERVSKVLDLVQLSEFASRKPSQLSGGQRQRVALARSLVKRPSVLLLDEPLSALDKKLREATQYELVNIQQQVGITFIMVTHDQEEAMTMSTRIAVMDKGKIVQVGSPAEIYEYPQNRFVATFIGSVNLFEGPLVENQTDHAAIESDEWGGKIQVGRAIGYSLGHNTTLGIRPEKVRIAKIHDPMALANRAVGRMKDIAYLGNSLVYHVALQSGKVLKITSPNLGSTSDRQFVRDEEVHVGWAPNACVVVEP
ncbi:ABC transporter ATP-binding protein [Telmatospirillum sp.]|uniref:ABC transporter ATP-binding protein n=1 Tax=Telmatospirillum sp. TaxID=2079197 RepID=UPI00283E9EBC|nr:ABC transporter ATP-binding protein [Telmatospirillum sp.]MDR3441273.1 ABC transporter ATP-binding protein [Telmatospirillum sp.]